MTRILILIVATLLLSACAQYREPKANCFNLVSRGPASVDCTFTPLSGPDMLDGVHE